MDLESRKDLQKHKLILAHTEKECVVRLKCSAELQTFKPETRRWPNLKSGPNIKNAK